MTSPWYRRIFPTRLAAHRQAVQEFVITRQGYRLATSTGGVLTGRGTDIIAIDDPLKPEEALSKTLRQACNEWYLNTLSTAGSTTSARAPSSSLCSGCTRTTWSATSSVWSRGKCSASRRIAETDEEHRIETIGGPCCFRRRRGEALHPEREPLAVLHRMRDQEADTGRRVAEIMLHQQGQELGGREQEGAIRQRHQKAGAELVRRHYPYVDRRIRAAYLPGDHEHERERTNDRDLDDQG
jgi:hypothetical protein